MATREEISLKTNKGSQFKIGKKLNISDLSNLEETCTVYIDNIPWRLAPIKYTKCLRLKHQKADAPEYSQLTKQVERTQILDKQELPLDSDIEIYEAIELLGDDRLLPVTPFEAFLPIEVACSDIIKSQKTDEDMPYLSVLDKVTNELKYLIVYFGKTESYALYDLPEPDSDNKLLGKKLLKSDSAGAIINFIVDNN